MSDELISPRLVGPGLFFGDEVKNYPVTPPKTNGWNLGMDLWKRRFLLETIISRFHVKFRGCIFRDYHKPIF